MMLGLVVHAGLTYASPSQQIWLVGDRHGSVAIDATVWFIHLFRMSLFYLIAGYFANLLIEKRGNGGFIKNRLIRIVLVFVLFWPILQVAFIAAIVFALGHVKELPPILAMIKNAPEGTPPPPPSLSHLWFLYYLAMFAILTLFIPLLRRFSIRDKVRQAMNNRFALVCLPILLVPAVMRAGTPLPAPESFVPQWWPFAFYGLFYVFGWWLRGNEEWLEKIDSLFIPLIVISLTLFIPYYLYLPVLTLEPVVNQSISRQWLEAILTSYLAVYLSLAMLILCKRLLNSPSRFFRFVADSSYWTYLIHLPLLLFLQALLVDYQINIWLKFAISLSATFGLCLVSYVVLVRYTPIGWMLNGRRKKVAQPANLPLTS